MRLAVAALLLGLMIVPAVAAQDPGDEEPDEEDPETYEDPLGIVDELLQDLPCEPYTAIYHTVVGVRTIGGIWSFTGTSPTKDGSWLGVWRPIVCNDS